MWLTVEATILNNIIPTHKLTLLLLFVAEFESWYNESFLLSDEVLSLYKDGPIRPGLVPVDKTIDLVSNTAQSIVIIVEQRHFKYISI